MLLPSRNPPFPPICRSSAAPVSSALAKWENGATTPSPPEPGAFSTPPPPVFPNRSPPTMSFGAMRPGSSAASPCVKTVPAVSDLAPAPIALHLEMKRCVAEFLGTFALVFAGTGAMVIDAASRGSISHAGVAMTFGLVILAMIYTFGDVSGAHLNPAVSVAFAVAGRFPWPEVPGYIAAQTGGALAASGLLRALFPADPTLGATLPAGSLLQSFVLEVVLTFFLMLVILSVSTGAKEKGITA